MWQEKQDHQKIEMQWILKDHAERQTILKKLFKTAKWTRNAVADTLTQTTIFLLIKSKYFDIIITMQNKAKMMF